MNTPRIWYLPFSTFSLTTKSWKLKKTWKCCLPFFFKKMQRHLWLSEWLPSLDLLHGRALHCSLKQLLRERSSKRRHPVSEGRTSGVSLPKVVEYTPQPPGGEGKWEHAPSTAPPKHSTALLPLAMHIKYLPTDYMDNQDTQTGAVKDRPEKLGQGFMLQNLKLPCCPHSVTLFKMFLLMLKKWKMGKLSFKSQCCLYKNAQYHIIVK